MPRPHDLHSLDPEFRMVLDRGQSALVLRAADRVEAVAAFSLRNGGDSPAAFDALNLPSTEGNPEDAVPRNFGTLAIHLGVDPASIVFPRQVHGDTVEILESSDHQLGEADALITSTPGTFLAVQTADCVPVLLLDVETRTTAAVHAGWKGTLLRITRKTIRIMSEEFGCNPASIMAAVGPCIGPCCYEVDDDVLDAFRGGFPSAEEFILSGSQAAAVGSSVRLPGNRVLHAARVQGKRPESASQRLDLRTANRTELLVAGVPATNIHVVALCTACYPELFFSHRRDRGKTGRHVAVAGFRA